MFPTRFDLNLTNKFSYRICNLWYNLIGQTAQNVTFELAFWFFAFSFRFFPRNGYLIVTCDRNVENVGHEKKRENHNRAFHRLWPTSKDGRHDNRVFRRKASGLVKERFKYFGVRKNLSVRFTRCSLEDQKWSGFPEHLAAIFVFIQYTFPFSLCRSKRLTFRNFETPKCISKWISKIIDAEISILKNVDYVFEVCRNFDFAVEKPKGIM